MTTPKKEPTTCTAGDTIKWAKSLPDYLPADGWTLSYDLVISSALESVTATDNGDASHLITITAAISAAYAPGIYHWQAYATKAAERYQVGAGTLEVKPNFAAQASGYDARSHVKQVLDALEATITGKASKDQSAYTINGRSLTRLTPAELITWRSKYRREYAAEQQSERIANGLSSGQNIRVRF